MSSFQYVGPSRVDTAIVKAGLVGRLFVFDCPETEENGGNMSREVMLKNYVITARVFGKDESPFCLSLTDVIAMMISVTSFLLRLLQSKIQPCD